MTTHQENKSTVAHSDREITFTRVLDAPIELVYQVWTDAKHLAQWWGPHEFTNPVCEADARPGGHILIHMQSPDGFVNPVKGQFLELEYPTHIKFMLKAFPDEQGNDMIENHNTVTLTEQDGKTLMKLHAKAVHVAPPLEEAVKGQAEGWNQSLDRFETVVRQLV